MLVWALMLSATPVEQPTLHLDAGTLTATLSARLHKERPELLEVATATVADLRVRLRPNSGGWLLEAYDRYDVQRAGRELSQAATQAALRQAVIVILGALDRLEEAPPTPPPPPTAVTRSAVAAAAAWHVGLQGAAELWTDGSAVRLGAAAWLLRDLGPLQVGAGFRFAGPCCGGSTSELDGSHVDGALTAQARLSSWWTPRWGWNVGAGAGLSFGRLTAQATVFQGQAAPESRTALGFEAEASAGVHFGLAPGLSLLGSLGGRIRAPTVRLVLPAPFTGDALDTGFFTPWIRFGLEATLF